MELVSFGTKAIRLGEGKLRSQINCSSRLGLGHRAYSPIPENIHLTETATEEINTTGCDGLSESL